MLMLETTCLLNNMKIADINSKYVDYIRNHKLVEKYNLYDEINSMEFDDRLITNIGDLFYGNKDFQLEYPSEFDLEIAIDTLIVDFRNAYNNQLKFESNPEYDIEPWLDEDTESELKILDNNAIPVWVEQDGVPVRMYVDKRVLDGSIWKTKD